jgi:hypothetical protein
MMPRGAPRAHVCEKRSRSHARTSLGPMENVRQRGKNPAQCTKEKYYIRHSHLAPRQQLQQPPQRRPTAFLLLGNLFCYD